MTKETDVFTLPAAPKGLCFDKNYFVRSNFSVDSFLHEHRHVKSLETIRDDLGVYLKILRSAMIELINKDYADFVNLSATLIGLDKGISGIQTPLGQLREEIMHVKQCLEDAMKELALRLEQRKALRIKKQSLHYYKQTQNTLKKLSLILHISENQRIDPSLEIIERAAVEYNQLQYAIDKCSSLVTNEQSDLFTHIGKALTTALGQKLLSYLREKNNDAILRCLNVYATLNKVADVEFLIRKEVVAVALHNIISESALQRNENALGGVYKNIFEFLDRDFKAILHLTQNYGKTPPVRGYNILLNSVWTEVEERIEIHMSSIFAPGNPEAFFERYNESMQFIARFEMYFGNKQDVATFHSHPKFKVFRQRWNLPVYFQIRFQEIAGDFEATLVDTPITNKPEDKSEFHLAATSACWKSLQLCWGDRVFLKSLGHRFWKLTLQILSRYTVWAKEFLKQKSTTEKDAKTIAQIDMIDFSMWLYIDIGILRAKQPQILEIAIAKLTDIENSDVLRKSLNESDAQLANVLPNIKRVIVSEIASKCVVHLKQVNDIPRLFRKTNKDMPTQPCSYVGSLTKTPIDFHWSYSRMMEKSSMAAWLEEIFSEITEQYYTAVDSVLTSVQKTEESLRRLKEIRDRSVQQSTERSVGVTDDDKIRMQLVVDAKSYYEAIVNIDINRVKVKKLSDLMNLMQIVQTDVHNRGK